MQQDQRQELTTEETKSLLHKLHGRACHVCGETDWEVSSWISEMRLFHRGELAMQDGVFPTITAHCTACGHTVLFNARVRGIVKSAQRADGHG